MKKKKILIIGGVVLLVAGVGFYFWNKNKKSNKDANEGLESKPADTTAKSEDGVDKKEAKTPAPNEKTDVKTASTEENKTPIVKKLTAQELEMKLQSACGKKPLLKKNKALYNQCRAKETDKLAKLGMVEGYNVGGTAIVGTSSFEGVVDKDFFSGFDNNFDLNL
jgi:cytoskeletal protein RodZ